MTDDYDYDDVFAFRYSFFRVEIEIGEIKIK